MFSCSKQATESYQFLFHEHSIFLLLFVNYRCYRETDRHTHTEAQKLVQGKRRGEDRKTERGTRQSLRPQS